MAPIINPVSDACAQSSCEGFELGPAGFVFTPLCTDDGSEEFTITCAEQRNDSSMAFADNAIEIPNQCSTVTTMRPGGFDLTWNISLGSAICRPEVWAAFTNSEVISDGEGENCTKVKYNSRAARYKHWQVAAIPYDGTEPSEDFGFVIYYAVLMLQGANLTFGPSAPRELTAVIKAEPHPETQELGESLFGCSELIRELSAPLLA